MDTESGASVDATDAVRIVVTATKASPEALRAVKRDLVAALERRRLCVLVFDAEGMPEVPFSALPQVVGLVCAVQALAEEWVVDTTLRVTEPAWAKWVQRLTSFVRPTKPLRVLMLPRGAAARLGMCVRHIAAADPT